MKGDALFKYITSHPLAILPSYLEVISSAIKDWPEGNLLQVDAAVGTDNNQVNGDGIKVLSYSGTIMKSNSGLNALSGGISTLQMKKDIQAAINDSSVDGIVLSIDSPGGTVDGTKELADYILSVRGTKPIVAYADGLMASAAYWIGASTDAIVAYDTTQVGSIGVIMTHLDYSGAAEKEGIKPTVMRAGKYKALGNRYEPLSNEAKELLQNDLDYYYSMFIDHVAESRAVTPEVVVGVMAEGRIFIGTKAKEAGLVDEIGGIEEAIKLTLELGGKNVDKKVQEALVNGDLPEVLSTLATRDNLPEGVKTAITAAITPVEKVEIEKSVYEGLLSDAKESTTKLEDMEAQLEEAKSTIEILQATTAQTEKETSVKALFADSGYEVSDELMKTLLGMDADAAKVVADNLMETKAHADEAAKVLLKDPIGNSTEPESTVPQTLDEAVTAVMAENPDMSVEDAIAEANDVYPELFKRK